MIRGITSRIFWWNRVFHHCSLLVVRQCRTSKTLRFSEVLAELKTCSTLSQSLIRTKLRKVGIPELSLDRSKDKVTSSTSMAEVSLLTKMATCTSSLKASMTSIELGAGRWRPSRPTSPTSGFQLGTLTSASGGAMNCSGSARNAKR